MACHSLSLVKSSYEARTAKINSYNAGDCDNSVNWDLVNKNSDAVEYFKALIKLRNEIPALRDSTYSDVNKNMHWIKSSDGINAFSVDAKDKTYVFIFNANDNVTDVNIGKEKYRVRIADGKSNGDDASKFPEASVDDSGNYKVAALSTAVLVKDAEKKDESKPGTQPGTQPGTRPGTQNPDPSTHGHEQTPGTVNPPAPKPGPVNPKPASVPTPTPGETQPGTHNPNPYTPGHEETPW